MPASSTVSQDLFILSVFTLRLILEYLLGDGYCLWRKQGQQYNQRDLVFLVDGGFIISSFFKSVPTTQLVYIHQGGRVYRCQKTVHIGVLQGARQWRENCSRVSAGALCPKGDTGMAFLQAAGGLGPRATGVCMSQR